MTTRIDTAELLNILRRAARAEILPRFRRLEVDHVRTKSSIHDLVTDADEAAERMIKAEVARIAPDAVFIGEESAAADPALLSRLADAELAVVVDPIDGTYNFASGLPLFGVMAAVIRNGETIAGLILDPLGDDCMIAEKGGGAWLRHADGLEQRQRVAAPVPMDQMFGLAGVGFMPRAEAAAILCNMGKVRSFASYRCAAHEYRLFAGGHCDFVMYSKLLPWDHAAGVLIAQEAGGHVARLDGTAYDVRSTDGRLLMTADRDGWETLRSDVFGG